MVQGETVQSAANTSSGCINRLFHQQGCVRDMVLQILQDFASLPTMQNDASHLRSKYTVFPPLRHLHTTANYPRAFHIKTVRMKDTKKCVGKTVPNAIYT